METPLTAWRECATCKDLTVHHSIKKPGSKLLEWVCSVCGTNSGAH